MYSFFVVKDKKYNDYLYYPKAEDGGDNWTPDIINAHRFEKIGDAHKAMFPFKSSDICVVIVKITEEEVL